MPKKKDRDGIYTRPDRDGFWMSYRDANGNRRQVKTAATTVADAKKVRAARLARVEKMKVLGVAEADAVTFEAVTQRYLAYQKPRISAQSYDRTHSIIQKHLITFSGFKRNIGEIRTAAVEKFVTQRMGEASAGTVIKELSIIKHLFRLAVKWELIPTDPSADVEAPPSPPERVRYLEPDELTKVLEHCPDWLKPIVVIAVSTGMRRGEILGLRWSHVDFRNRQILLSKTKNGESRVVNLNKIAMKVLEMLYPGQESTVGKLFPDVQPNYVSKWFTEMARRAKIEDFRFHDLRHTYASWVKMSGEDVHTVAILLGHKDIRMTKRYAHLSSSYLSNATAKIEGVFPALLSGHCDQDVTEKAAPETDEE